jgi:hemolysin III
MKTTLSENQIHLLVAGGLLYILGALIYAVKFPNPSPRYFGYHEIFHLIVIIAAALHFIVIDQILN